MIHTRCIFHIYVSLRWLEGIPNVLFDLPTYLGCFSSSESPFSGDLVPLDLENPPQNGPQSGCHGITITIPIFQVRTDMDTTES
jgi:hypothetical protein